jgi:hypothetical protein
MYRQMIKLRREGTASEAAISMLLLVMEHRITILRADWEVWGRIRGW